MAIEGSSNESTGTFSLYTGLENFNILEVSPSTKEKWNSLGFNFEQEPNYIGTWKDPNTDKEYKQARLDFVLQNSGNSGHDILTTATYFVVETKVISSTGKTQYTNHYGQFAYLESLENIPSNMSWFSLEGIRPAFRGEEQLVEMLKNFANVKRGGKCYIEKPSALFVGNFSEIREYINAFPNNKVKFLLTIRLKDDVNDEGIVTGVKYYQNVYTRKTERPYSKDFTYLQKDIDEWRMNGGGSNLEIPEYPYTLTEWSPQEEKPASSEWDVPAQKVDW